MTITTHVTFYFCLKSCKKLFIFATVKKKEMHFLFFFSKNINLVLTGLYCLWTILCFSVSIYTMSWDCLPSDSMVPFGIFRWFYRQIHLLYSNEPVQIPSVFEYNPESSKLRLRETVSIHMYISTAPCGDASAFPIESVLLLYLLLNYIGPNGYTKVQPKWDITEHSQLFRMSNSQVINIVGFWYCGQK